MRLFHEYPSKIPFPSGYSDSFPMKTRKHPSFPWICREAKKLAEQKEKVPPDPKKWTRDELRNLFTGW